MAVRRKQARFLILSLVLAALVGVGLLSYRALQKGSQVLLETGDMGEILPEAVQWIRDFKRLEIHHGKKTWEVEGDEAQYLEEDGRVLVRQPRASFYSDDGDEVHVEGSEGDLYFEGRDLQKVELRDNVVLRVRDLVVKADQATYDRAEGRIVAPGPVKIFNRRLHIQGEDMVVFVEEERARIQKNVRALLLSEPMAEGETAT